MTIRKTVIHTADRVSGSIDQAVQVAIVLVFVVLFLLLNLQVAMRYVMRVPLIWLEELAGFLMAYLTLWGSSSCIRTDRHVRVSFLPDKITHPALSRWLSIFVHGTLLFYLFYLTVFGYRFAAMGQGEITPSGTFDFFLPRLALTSGGILMIIQSLNIMTREVLGLFGGDESGGEEIAE
jgi:TRAP-type transport system small permease protein